MLSLSETDPRWIATLEDGREFVGKPSWLGMSAELPLPQDKDQPISDWRRLQQLCEEESAKIKRLSLWIPAWGFFRAPDGCGAYGYYEEHLTSLNADLLHAQPRQAAPMRGVRALCLCWDEGPDIKVMKVYAAGTLEYWTRRRWLPCMIGEQTALATSTHEGKRVS